MLIWFPVENKSSSSCIYHEITMMWSIIKIICCNTSIDDVDSQNPYLMYLYEDLFSMPKEVINITMQSILGLLGEPYGIMKVKTPKFSLVTWVQCKSSCDMRNCNITTFNFNIDRRWKLFLVTWVQCKSSCDTSKFIIRTFTFATDRRCISACSLNYDVHVVTCLHGFRIS